MLVRLEGEGGLIHVVADDEVVRFNSLPFRAEGEPQTRDLALCRVIDATPPFPFGVEGVSFIP